RWAGAASTDRERPSIVAPIVTSAMIPSSDSKSSRTSTRELLMTAHSHVLVDDLVSSSERASTRPNVLELGRQQGTQGLSARQFPGRRHPSPPIGPEPPVLI